MRACTRRLIVYLTALGPSLFTGCQEAHHPASAAPLAEQGAAADHQPTARLAGRASDGQSEDVQPTAGLAGRASDGQSEDVQSTAGLAGSASDGQSAPASESPLSSTTPAQTPEVTQGRPEPSDDVQPPAEAAPDNEPSSPPAATAAAELDAGEPLEVAAAPVIQASAPPPAANDEQKTRDITFDTIKFDMEKDDPYDRELIGPEIEALTGKNIKIRGYILPASVFKQTGITGFVLVRDNMECCFGPGAALYDCIVVQMKPGKTTDFTVRPVAVEGTFKIEELENPVEPDGNPIAIYHLDGEAVE
jgi:hypothetical protein